MSSKNECPPCSQITMDTNVIISQMTPISSQCSLNSTHYDLRRKPMSSRDNGHQYHHNERGSYSSLELVGVPTHGLAQMRK